MSMSKEDTSKITKNIQASISLDWIIKLTKELNESEHREILLDMKQYYMDKALNILRESGIREMDVYPKRNTMVTLTIKALP